MKKNSGDRRMVLFKRRVLFAIALYPVANNFLTCFRLTKTLENASFDYEEIDTSKVPSMNNNNNNNNNNNLIEYNGFDTIFPSLECSRRKSTTEFKQFCNERTHSKNQCQKLTVVQTPLNTRREKISPTGVLAPLTNSTATSSRRGLSDANYLQFNHQNNESYSVLTNPTASLPRTNAYQSNNHMSPTCKTIWVTGMSMGFGGKHHVANRGDGYALQYAAALRSYQANAENLLQPVLIIITPPPSGNSTNNDNNHTGSIETIDDDNSLTSKFTRWLESQGVIVIHIHSLTFQNLIFQAYPKYAENGAIAYYLRFDIPTILMESHPDVLRNRPDICWNSNEQNQSDQGNVVLYTDSDILFAQPILHEELNSLRNQLSSEKFLMYGQDFLIDRPKPSNTGVMLMHLEGFRNEWPKIHRWGKDILQGTDTASAATGKKRNRRRQRRERRQRRQRKKRQRRKKRERIFPPHDQIWLNQYFANPAKWSRQNLLLPPAWNWKVYWELDANSNAGKSDTVQLYGNDRQPLVPIKVIHFHGPKPQDGVEEIAKCDIEAVSGVLQDNAGEGELASYTPAFHRDYEMLVSHGMCCDLGKTASWTLQLYDRWRPPTSPW